ncbi:MAG: cell wall hydrolase, partial [Caulobacteraceae bacterium]
AFQWAMIGAAILALGACAKPDPPPSSAHLKGLATEVGGFSRGGLARLEDRMGPASAALAERLDQGPEGDLGARTTGWARLDIADDPGLGLGRINSAESLQLNGFIVPEGAAGGAPPFVLRTSGAERARALLCLTQAIYYEAALQPLEGQEAVAQTILNRVRNPAFPHTICGVVYQGSSIVNGCQFSFACDGSKQRPPIAPFWQEAETVAKQAVSGFVLREIGTATSYHADYVFPNWSPTLVKIARIGSHIFYRFPGPAGLWSSFNQRYSGGELSVAISGPSATALAAARAAGAIRAFPSAVVALAAVDPVVAQAGAEPASAEDIREQRAPTPDEIARINKSLAAMEGPAPPSLDPSHSAKAGLAD